MDFFQRTRPSREIAKERLRLVLVHDRAMVSPALLEALKDEMLEVVSRYLEIDVQGTEVRLSTTEERAALVASIPVRRVLRSPEF